MSANNQTLFGVPCLGLGEIFFDKTRAVQAKALCAECERREQCLQEALDNRLDYGIWGGATTLERQAMRRSDDPTDQENRFRVPGIS